MSGGHDARCTCWASDDPTRCDCRSTNGHRPRRDLEDNWAAMTLPERADTYDRIAATPQTGHRP